MGINRKFEGSLSDEDFDKAEAIICLGTEGCAIAVNPASPFSLEDVADALHVLSHKLYASIDEWKQEAEKN